MHGLKIAVLAVALALALPAGARAPDNLDTLRKRSLGLVNGARAEAGLAGLEAGAALMAAAQAVTIRLPDGSEIQMGDNLRVIESVIGQLLEVQPKLDAQTGQRRRAAC